MAELEEEIASLPSYRKPENEETEKETLKSRTVPARGYIHQVQKRGGDLTQMTMDTSHGIITDVDCYPANQQENDRGMPLICNSIEPKKTGKSV